MLVSWPWTVTRCSATPQPCSPANRPPRWTRSPAPQASGARPSTGTSPGATPSYGPSRNSASASSRPPSTTPAWTRARRSKGCSRLVAEAERDAQLLAFLVTENQLFEGDQVNEGWARLDARVSALFRRGQEEGDIRIDLSPAWLTEALYGLIGTCAWAVMDGRVAAKDFQYMITELLLGGARRSVEK